MRFTRPWAGLAVAAREPVLAGGCSGKGDGVGRGGAGGCPGGNGLGISGPMNFT